MQHLALDAAVEQNPLLRFADMPWNEIVPGAREKAFRREFTTVRLLQLSPGFEETEWCLRQHFGFILAGTLEVHFPHGIERFHQGDGISIPAGEANKHRSIVGDEPVTMFLVDPH